MIDTKTLGLNFYNLLLEMGEELKISHEEEMERDGEDEAEYHRTECTVCGMVRQFDALLAEDDSPVDGYSELTPHTLYTHAEWLKYVGEGQITLTYDEWVKTQLSMDIDEPQFHPSV